MTEEKEPTETPNINPLTMGELITMSEAAQLSGLTANFLRKLAKEGKLKARRSGSIWLTTAAAVEEYKTSRSFKNIPKKYRDRD